VNAPLATELRYWPELVRLLAGSRYRGVDASSLA
jgi:hypothetical protein